MKKLVLALSLTVALGLVFGSCRSTPPAAYELPKAYPATVQPWPNEDDELAQKVVFNKPFALGSYPTILVAPVDSSSTIFNIDSDGKAGGANKDKETDGKIVIRDFDKLFFETISDAGEKLPLKIVQGASASKALILKPKLLVACGGEAALRWAVGMGAGHTTIRIEVALVDSDSDEVLAVATFEDTGNHGKSVDRMKESVQTIAEEQLVPLLNSFKAAASM